MHFFSSGNLLSQGRALISSQKAASAREEQTFLQLFRSVCVKFLSARSSRIIQKKIKRAIKKKKCTSDKKRPRGYLPTLPQTKGAKSLCTLFFRHQHYSAHRLLENGESRASHPALQRYVQLNADQAAPAGTPARSLSKAEAVEW